MRAEPIEVRFAKYVDRKSDDECWMWTGCVLPTGYGQIGEAGKVKGAHRASYEIHKGPIPKGAFVCHKCDTPGCVNPNHLFLGSPADNVRDKMRKGRHRFTFGEGHYKAKLSADDVLAILHDERPDYQIAADYGIDPSTASDIRNGRSWRQLTNRTPENSPRRVVCGTRLREDQVLAIFQDPRNQAEIAADYRTTQATVSKIKTGRTWSYLTGKHLKKSP